MNVLSLFDGCSGGQQALERAGIKYNKYYASEIDKYAIQVTQHNYPDTIQLGNVVDVDVTKLEPIDLLIGGSPCQSFSFAGKRNGMTTSCSEEIYTLERYLELKQEGFQFEGESYLFWEYMRILTDIRKYNPDVLFLLENVEMGAKWERVLSEAIGIYGVHINSALVSAQNRKRIYWTNIRVKEVGLFGELHSDIPQPEDRGILLKDILEDEVDEKYYIANKSMMNFITDEWRLNKKYTQINGEKGLPQMARQYSNWNGDYVCVAMRGRGENNEQTLEPQLSGKTNTLTSVQKDNLIYQRPRGYNKGGIFKNKAPSVSSSSWEQNNLVVQLNPSTESGGKQPYQHNRIYDANGISPCLNTDARSPAIVIGCDYRSDEGLRYRDNDKSGTLQARARNDESCGQLASVGSRIRRLTPVECERLQTMKDNYTAVVSDTQRYKMIGNGWTIDVIAHIFSFINDGKTR